MSGYEGDSATWTGAALVALLDAPLWKILLAAAGCWALARIAGALERWRRRHR